MRISDWSSDVCSSDFGEQQVAAGGARILQPAHNDRAAMNPLSPHHLVKYRAERILAVEAYLERGGRAPDCVGRPIDERHDLEPNTCLHRPFHGRTRPRPRARCPRPATATCPTLPPPPP